ncbi:MAG TPA: GTPase Era, partial [Gammaproteobacteria bacterium]|nr:GTPase Era [Gammaproteobacteria bacterium]
MQGFRCGYIALVGRPNVGKSTLLNRILGQKISITSRRPQTTRHRVLGIKTLPQAQLIYVDTPGIHDFNGRAMNRHMNRTASSVLADVDVVVFLVEGLRWTADDDLVLKKLAQTGSPVILAVNKIDTLEKREAMLPGLQALAQK